MLGPLPSLAELAELCALSVRQLTRGFRASRGCSLGEHIAQRNKQNKTAVQSILARAIPFIGVIGMSLIILVLSSALLPNWKILLALLVILAAVTTFLWSSLIRIYSKAQIALQDTLAETPAPYSIAPAPIANLLREAKIETVTIMDGSPAKGKLISELGLRTRTGASIVAIERNGETIINPGPDEEIHTNDQLLLLAKASQLEAARRELAPAGAA